MRQQTRRYQKAMAVRSSLTERDNPGNWDTRAFGSARTVYLSMVMSLWNFTIHLYNEHPRFNGSYRVVFLLKASTLIKPLISITESSTVICLGTSVVALQKTNSRPSIFEQLPRTRDALSDYRKQCPEVAIVNFHSIIRPIKSAINSGQPAAVSYLNASRRSIPCYQQLPNCRLARFIA